MPGAIRFSLPVLLLFGSVGCHSIGNPFVRKNESEKAAEMIAAQKSMKNPDRVYLWYARWQEGEGQLQQAEQSYQQVLKEKPRSVDAQLGLARVAQKKGKMLEAERQFEHVVKKNPKNAVALDGIGEFYASQQRWNEAINALTAATQADPTQSIYRYHLATATAKSGDLQSAYPHFVKAVGAAEAHYNIGHFLYERGELQAAEQQFELALQKKPGLPHAVQMLAQLRPAPKPNQNGVQLASGVRDSRPKQRPVVRTSQRRLQHHQPTLAPRRDEFQQPSLQPQQRAPQQPFPQKQHHEIQIQPGVPTAQTGMSPSSFGQFQAPIVRGSQPITPPDQQMVAPPIGDWHSR